MFSLEIILGGLLSNCNDFNFDETREIWSDLERTITAHDRRASGTRTQNILFTSRTHNQQHPIAVTNGLFDHFDQCEKMMDIDDFRDDTSGILRAECTTSAIVDE